MVISIMLSDEISMLHNIFVQSEIWLRSAQMLLKEHKCQCGDFVAVFKPHVVVLTSQHQKTWYENQKEIYAEYNLKICKSEQH